MKDLIRTYIKISELNNIKTFKLALKELVRQDDVIEDVVKSYNGKTIFVILKNFPKIKTDFLEQYGYDNRRVNAGEKTEFINKIINPPLPLIIQ